MDVLTRFSLLTRKIACLKLAQASGISRQTRISHNGTEQDTAAPHSSSNNSRTASEGVNDSPTSHADTTTQKEAARGTIVSGSPRENMFNC